MIYNTKNTYRRYTELPIAMLLIISITSFSIIENDRNDIKFRLKFNTDKLPIREAKIMSASTIFTIQNIENSTSLEKTIDEINKFQKKLSSFSMIFNRSFSKIKQMNYMTLLQSFLTVNQP